MPSVMNEFKQKYPDINISDDSFYQTTEDDDGNEQEELIEKFRLTNIPYLDGFSLVFDSHENFQQLDRIITSSPEVFKDVFGMKIRDEIQVVLLPVRPKSPLLFFVKPRKLSLTLGYKSKLLNIYIQIGSVRKIDLAFLALHMEGVRSMRSSAIAKITGLDTKNLTELENDVRSVLRSILFDVECTYDEAFEIANFESLKLTQVQKDRKKPGFPETPVNLLYKQYIPELVEYFHTGECVDHLPFKFICYFHIIEYFMDKSAHTVVAKKLKQIISSPDFHQKSTEYINEAIKIFKIETEKFMTDKTKINRVLTEYLDKDSLVKFLTENGLKDYFNQDHTFKCIKDLKIPALKFDSETTFFDSLQRRIYSIRCSIVHSNPDFDESKAVPFSPTPHNMNLLRREIELIKEVSRIIVVNSAIN